MKVILMHGKNADPNQKWYPWLAKEVNNLGMDFIAPVLPQTEDPRADEWIAELEKLNPDKNTILIGHSRGGVAILRYLEKLTEDKKVYKVILVATNAGHSEKINKTENNKSFFSEKGYDFKKIKSHCNNFVVFHSRDDHVVPFQAGEENAYGLNAKFIKFDDRRHFGRKVDGSMTDSFPELLEEIN